MNSSRRNPLPLIAIVALSLIAAQPLSAGVIDAQSATSILHGQDRELTQLGFVGSPTVMTGTNFLVWSDGYILDGGSSGGLYGWNTPQPRDVGTGDHKYDFNPDRADGSTPYADEATSEGTLAEVFGPFGSGYKNMSRLIDGETRSATSFVDLYLADGIQLGGDGNDLTVEVALLERGGNSKMRVYGILAGDTPAGGYSPVLTGSSVLVDHTVGSFNSLWKLNSLEIGGSQKVRGYGVSLPNDWQGLTGLRVAMEGKSFKGPDLIAVGAVPEPMTLSVLAAGSLLMLRRRRH